MRLQPCTIRSPAFSAISHSPVRIIVQPVPHFRPAKALNQHQRSVRDFHTTRQLQILLRRTRVGLGIRAVSDDLLGALYAGVNADRVIVWTFAIGSAIGAVAGVLVGLYYGTIMPYMGFTPTLKAFVAMLMGGMTSIPGAVACAILIGLCESFTTEFVSSRWVDMVPYTLLLLTLLVFPRGLFGRSVDRA